jgi:glycine/D-amino acid oxidase-like deaminating enzyme
MGGRLTIIGGGVMGLMTAYYAAPLAEAVTVLEPCSTARCTTSAASRPPGSRAARRASHWLEVWHHEPVAYGAAG